MLGRVRQPPMDPFAKGAAFFTWTLGKTQKDFFWHYFEKKPTRFSHGESAHFTELPLAVPAVRWSTEVMLQLAAEKSPPHATDVNIVCFDAAQKKRVFFFFLGGGGRHSDGKRYATLHARGMIREVFASTRARRRELRGARAYGRNIWLLLRAEQLLDAGKQSGICATLRRCGCLSAAA
ncbi:lysine-specific demethylase NO66 [Trypanosoma rangeli]|uniref:Lysine-specific demethylase NO66 n=1 Tax=Trypanosoma rangeli TaxID=5698 RepID=A0A3R7RR35_TRYRA|nr:lysine-specific demethylase NO66 [Trypanosoma rangeli]RNF11069.1 lysine-specific demethylase NO66 [Trypanosoma rangeli]|eukprot:RNF11069.1 lysine-specific demethylase NO66 [Trypanosoma rangeli]